ncbi:permease-like cell division protein FtsX [Romboutsia sp. 1001713B170207_170306_H8]|uniref:permease-like cell division protein FtsX n=1 Tax=Romboutsia sp. 1001713B170207_170306_H8 TaxID=2787112 RepID=UPI00189A00BD|nr:permease-like cell division protein FtsX [Romboutsia sp. 1001713B170207_170306_H8]
MKILSNFIYNLKQGLNGLVKNKTMSLISVISVSSALIILGIIITIVLNINQFIEVTKDQVNEVKVSVVDNLDESQSKEVKEILEKIEGVKTVTYKSKEDSFNSMKEDWGDDGYLLEGIKNPLDDTYTVTLKDSDNIDTVAKEIETVVNVKEVKYHQDIIKNFLNLSNTVKKFGGILIIALLLICLIIISNTIKSRVYSKKEEIEIIKYVGASNGFVVGPFIVEGFIIGLLGSVLSVAVCTSMYGYMVEKISGALSNMMGNMVVPLNSISISLILILFATGIAIGVLGSIVSVRKHLKV